MKIFAALLALLTLTAIPAHADSHVQRQKDRLAQLVLGGYICKTYFNPEKELGFKSKIGGSPQGKVPKHSEYVWVLMANSDQWSFGEIEFEYMHFGKSTFKGKSGALPALYNEKGRIWEFSTHSISSNGGPNGFILIDDIAFVVCTDELY